MNKETEPKTKFKIGQTVCYVDNEHRVKKYKVCAIRVCVTKSILNTPFMTELDRVDVYYNLVNEHGNSVIKNHSSYFCEEALYADEYQARMVARKYLNDDIISLNEKMKKIKKIAQTNNSRIGKLEKSREEKKK